MNEFKLLREANILRDREWNPHDLLTLSFRGNELSGEIGEACNVIKKLEREKLGLVGSRANGAMLAEELADGIVCIDLIAMQMSIPLWDHVRQKFNKTSKERGLTVMI